MRVIQIMYRNTRSQIRVSNTFGDVFNVQAGVHQGSILSPLLFIDVLEAFLQGLRTDCPWEFLHANDLVLLADTMKRLFSKHRTSKEYLKTNGVRVNMSKTQV